MPLKRDVLRSGNLKVLLPQYPEPVTDDVDYVRVGRERECFYNCTYIVIKAAILLAEAAEIFECIVGRKVLKLHNKVGEDLLHCIHELIHELVHL